MYRVLTNERNWTNPFDHPTQNTAFPIRFFMDMSSTFWINGGLAIPSRNHQQFDGYESAATAVDSVRGSMAEQE